MKRPPTSNRCRGRSSWGGWLKEVPKPHRRYYDDARRKRTVEVGVSRFWGQGDHYYVRLKQDDNPIWDTNSESWRVAWDDHEKGEGLRLSKKFANRVFAHEWIDKQMAKYFPGHKLVWLEENVTARWFYKTEGD